MMGLAEGTYRGRQVDRDTLERLYVGEQLSQAETALRLGFRGGSTISKWLHIHGIPTRPASARSDHQRIWSKVDKSDGCWLWTGHLDDLGYGLATVDGRRIGAHRAVYLLLVGPIPEGLELDHLCRVPSCVNPAHLEPVTHRINLLRGTGPSARAAAATACPAGHPYDQLNTSLSRGVRRCKACKRAWYHTNKGRAA